MKARRKGVCVCCACVRKREGFGKGQSRERNRVAKGGGKGSARHAQVLRSDDLEKGRGQHPGTQA